MIPKENLFNMVVAPSNLGQWQIEGRTGDETSGAESPSLNHSKTEFLDCTEGTGRKKVSRL